MNFWETVDLVCEYRGIARKELAYKADFSVSCISTGIARNSMPFVDVACRIAKVLGVSVEFLLEKSSREIADASALKESTDCADDKKEVELTAMISEKERLFYKYEGVLSDLEKIPTKQQKPLFAYIHAIGAQA